MMRLLEKTETNRLKALERKKEVEEGLKLAKTVDELRRVKGKEEENLRKFRDSSIQLTKNDIDVLIEKKNSLNQEITALEEKRLTTQAPLDFTKELENLKKQREDLANRETQIIFREIILHDLDKKVQDVAKKEKEATEFFNESRKAYTEVDNLRNNIKQTKDETEKILKNRADELSKQEETIFTREMTFKARFEQIDKDKDDIRIQNTRLIERESKLEADNKDLSQKQEQVRESELLVKRYKEESLREYTTANNLKTETERIKNNAEHIIKEKLDTLNDKERELGYKERDIILEKENLEKEKKEIELEKQHIASQQETLRQAWINLKRLQK